MKDLISVRKDKEFFKYPFENGLQQQPYYDYYLKNTRFFGTNKAYALYKKKYWLYEYYTKKHSFNKRIFQTKDIPFKKPITRFFLGQDMGNYPIREVQSLPKTLKVLIFQYMSSYGWKLDIDVLPKKLVSLSFTWCWVPLSGADLTKLKHLKIFNVYDSTMDILPELPKTIESISLRKVHMKEFELNIQEYPKLKYLDVRGSINPKNIPKEWKRAKKEGKITILW